MTPDRKLKDEPSPSRRAFFGALGLGMVASVLATGEADAQESGESIAAGKAMAAPAPGEKPKEPSPEEKMARRFPQPVRISYLLGLPMIDERNEVLGHVRHVVRNDAGKIRLVIDYGGLFGIGARLVAVPVEVCAMLGRQVAAADMPRDAFEPAPTWYGSGDEDIGANETIRVAVMRR